MGGHKSGVNAVKFNTKGNYFASGSDDKKVYIWKTTFAEVDEQLGITPKSTKESKVKYSIETPIEQEEENEKPRGILKEKSINVKESPNNFGGSSNQDSELSILSSKMDTIMKTLLLMDKRLSLVEDQMSSNEKNE